MEARHLSAVKPAGVEQDVAPVAARHVEPHEPRVAAPHTRHERGAERVGGRVQQRDAQLERRRARECHAAARESGVAEHVTFVPSFSDAERALMLRHAALLLYTPPNEHFGIVPLEAMYSGVPVVACASGGPCETVLDGVTGRLCECDGDAFGRAALDILDGGDALRAKMGAAGRERVAQHFSLDAFSDKLADHIRSAIESKKGR